MSYQKTNMKKNCFEGPEPCFPPPRIASYKRLGSTMASEFETLTGRGDEDDADACYALARLYLIPYVW